MFHPLFGFVSGIFLFLGVCMPALTRAESVSPAVDGINRRESISASSELVRLSNGLSMLVIRDGRFPLVSTRLYVHAGSAFESAKESGISHLLEHMVFKGTKSRPQGAAARDVEAVGGYLNAYTGFDNTVYLTDMPAAHWKLSLDVVRDMAFHATLDPKDLASEKEVVISELQRGKDSPFSRIFDMLFAATLKGTPYARPVIGFEETVRAVTAQHMREYISRQYQPQSMLLVVVGNINPPEVIAEATRLFGGLKDTTPIYPPMPVRFAGVGDGPSVTVEAGPWNKVYLGMALPAPAQGDMRSITLDVLARLLAGDPASLLTRKYKYEKQLVHSIQMHNMSFERLGLLYLTAELDADKLEAFWRELCADLAHLDFSVFSAEELAAAKLNLEDEIHRSKETLGGLASWKGHLQFFLGGEAAEENILTFLRQVDVPALEEAARSWLRSDRAAAAVLMPKDAQTPDFKAALTELWPSFATPDTHAERDGNATEMLDLGQGRRLILLPDAALPYISLDIVRPGGDMLLSGEQDGLAALAARVLTTGTAKRTRQEIERFLVDRAANLTASADRQGFTLSLRGPARFFNDLTTLLSDMAQNPAFSPNETEREKNDQIAAIRAGEDKPLGLLFRRLSPFLFPKHPYGRLRLGEPDNVRKFTSEDVRAFWAKQVAQPWVMAVAGDFDRERVLTFARSLPGTDITPSLLEPPAWGRERDLTLSLPGRQQAHFMLIFKTVPDVHPDAPGLELLENILSGQSGPLFTELRDRQALAYTVAAFSRAAPEAGYMAFYIGTEPQKLKQAEAGFARVLRELHEKPLSAGDLERGVNRMEADYYRARQTLASRSGEAAGLSVLHRPLDFAREQIDKARRLKPKDIQALVGKYFKPETAYTARVLP